MNILVNVLRYSNALSLDIAIGAVCSSRLLYYILNIQGHWYYDLVLGLTVWLIYTADHLFDAYLIKNEADTLRHRFHQNNFRLLFVLACFVFLLIAFLALYHFPTAILFSGTLLMLFVIAHQLANYFSNDSFFLFGKEIRIALGYSLGLALCPFILANYVNIEAILALLVIFLLALINVLFFSTLEKESDQRQKMNSISLKWTISQIRSSIFIATASCLSLCLCFIYYFDFDIIGLLFLSMLLVLFLGFRKSNSLRYAELYRSLGDGIFLIPLIIFWL